MTAIEIGYGQALVLSSPFLCRSIVFVRLRLADL